MASAAGFGPGMGRAYGCGLWAGRGFCTGAKAHRTMGRCFPQGSGRSRVERWAGSGPRNRGYPWGRGMGRGLSSGRKIWAVGGATANSNLAQGGASRLRRPGDPGPPPPLCRDSHLLLVGPLLAGPGTLAALLLDSHHEAPMLSRSLAPRRPGSTRRGGHPHPHLHPRPRSWH